MRLRLIFYVLVAVIIAVFAFRYIHDRYLLIVPQVQLAADANQTTPTPITQNSSGIIPGLPATVLLKVPFTPQAPTGNWDQLHDADCEEASAVMANAYYNGPHDATLDPTYADEQLTNLTNWEMQNFGYNLDITSEETVQLIEGVYPNLHVQLVRNFDESYIQSQLAQNKLVLIPENGQMLGNPNYKSPGPIYHMLVIRGYTPSSIITNDPGTRNGLNYPYSYNTLYNGNGDWNHQTNSVDLSDKNILVVWE